jgi:hypothetical protein
MGGSTFVVVAEAEPWRFDPDEVFAALRETYAGRALWQGSDRRQLMAEGWADGWEVNVSRDGTAFVIGAPPASLVELVAWVRGHVPADVGLTIFDDQLTFDPTVLRPGITPEQVRAELYPDAWRVERMSPSGPADRDQRRRSAKPPHLP